MDVCRSQIHLVTCVSIVHSVHRQSAASAGHHLPLLVVAGPEVYTCVDGSHMGGSEYVHQEEGGSLGLRRNLQALGVAQRGLGQGLQHWGGPLGWQLSSLYTTS